MSKVESSTQEAELDSTAGSSACRNGQKANKRLAAVTFLLSLELGCFFLKLDWRFWVLHFNETEVVLKDNQFIKVITILILLICLYFLQYIKKTSNNENMTDFCLWISMHFKNNLFFVNFRGVWFYITKTYDRSKE